MINKIPHILLIALAGFIGETALGGTLTSRLYVDGMVGGTMAAGAASKWYFDFLDNETGSAPHHFHEMHDKPMHLVVVSEDLSTFAHIHPTHTPHTRKPFNITVNAPTSDPDNKMQPTAVLLPGRYFVFSEVMPMDYGMIVFPYNVEATGPKRTLEPIIQDTRESDGSFIKYFSVDHFSTPDGPYKATVTVSSVEHCGTMLPNISYTVQKRSLSGVFEPVKDLETWLSSFGHAIMISADGAMAESKSIIHFHAVWPLPEGSFVADRGPDIELMAHLHTPVRPGVYRAWLQFKHEGNVLTFPLTFEWNPPVPLPQSRSGVCFN